MKFLNKEKGVTLTILIVTIIVLLILASTATYTGIDTIQSARLTAFTTEMKIIQAQVDYLRDKIETDDEGNKKINGISISTMGQQVPNNSDIENMKNNMSTVWNQTVDLSAYRYYTSEDLKQYLNIEEIKTVEPILIDIENRSIISVKGLKYNNKNYYTLEQLPDNLNKVDFKETNIDKPTFEISSETTKDGMKIILKNIQIKSEYVKKYRIQYQAEGNSTWSTVAENLTSDTYNFNIPVAGNYKVKIIDAKEQESEEKSITVNEYKKLQADGSWNGVVNTPKIEGTGLIPIYWDDQGNEVEITEENQDDWYDYENKKWANAKSKDGSYWVWIPRYAYKITSNLGTTTVGEIQVKFVDIYNKNGDTIYGEEYPEVENNAMKDFVVHPAFTTNIENGGWNNDIPGFWIAKYPAGFQECTQTVNADGTITEPTTDTTKVKYSNLKYTSYNSSYTTNALSQNLTATGYSNEKISYPVFKPLTYAYNVISVGDCFTISKEMKNATDFYGLSNVDTHMQKNSEYGAAVYLSYCKYGTEGQELSYNNKNLNNLNNKNIYGVTGYGENVANEINSSSTLNMSGIFDLNGCVWIKASAFIQNGDNNLSLYGKSLLDETNVQYDNNILVPNTGKSTKYATIYPYNSLTDTALDNYTEYKNRQTKSYGFGDSILEVSVYNSVWFNSWSEYSRNTEPFMTHGRSFRDAGGRFTFAKSIGSPNDYGGFRVVIICE